MGMACGMYDNRNAYRVLAGEHEGDNFKNCGTDGCIILK